MLSFVLLWSLQEAVAISTGIRGRSRDEPDCSCDCCDVVERRPDEYVAGAGVKCAPSDQHSGDMCGEMCLPRANDLALAASSQGSVEYLRFCFFECKPAAGVESPVGTQCVVLEEAEQRQILDSQGNPSDPAILYDRAEVVTLPRGAGSVKRSSAAASVPVASILSVDQQQSVAEPTEPLVSQLSREAGSQEAGSEEEPESSEAAIGTQTSMEGAAGAGSLASSVRASESVRSLQDRDGAAQGEDVSEAQQLPWDPTQVVVPAAGSSDFAVVAAAHASASRAEQAAQGAEVSAQMAAAAARQARTRSLQDATIAATALQAQFSAKASAALRGSEGPARVGWREKVAEAAQRAARPYLQAAAQQQRQARDLNVNVNALAGHANERYAQSNRLERQAMLLNGDAQRQAAERKMVEAREVARQAQALSLKARMMMHEADTMTEAASQYKAAAQTVAASAAYHTNPEWAPPGWQPGARLNATHG